MRIIRRKWGKRWGRERINGKKRKILGRRKSKIHSTLKNYISSLYIQLGVEGGELPEIQTVLKIFPLSVSNYLL
jgi:hypothetical protein